MSPWYFNDVIVNDDSQFPDGALGFVYRITRLSDGKFYFGKKLCTFTKTSVKTVLLKNGTKKKKKIKSQVPSDWKTYWSSSTNLVKDVQELGEDAFRRDILCYCPSKGTLSYMELKYQMDHRVLEAGDKTYNGIVSCRINWKHLRMSEVIFP